MRGSFHLRSPDERRLVYSSSDGEEDELPASSREKISSFRPQEYGQSVQSVSDSSSNLGGGGILRLIAVL